MLSKEEKLRYGEILRQQKMREKEEKKKQEEMMKRGAPLQPPQRAASDRFLVTQPTLVYAQDPKEVLQKKLEGHDYNPFGRAGGGAPNPRVQQNVTVNAEGNYSGMVNSNRTLCLIEEQQYPPRQHIPPNYKGQEYPLVYQNQSAKLPTGSVDSYEMPKNVSYQPPPIYQKATIDYPSRQQYQYHQNQPQMHKAPHQYQQEPPRGHPAQPQQQKYPQPNQFQQQPVYQEAPYSHPTDPRVEMAGQAERVRTLQNEEMQEMYRRGGRNLLKLQNETVNEHLVKQRQKLEMQAFLKQQMQEAQMRKQMEKEKLKREEMEEERRNRQYIELQNQKLRDEQRKKNEEKQKIVDENLKNLARRKELEQQAKDKLERERQAQVENERRREQQDREKKQRAHQQRERERIQPERQGVRSKLSRAQPTDSLSSTSSEHTTQGRGFNTDISREFFRKEREREPEKFRNDKKLEMFTNEIQKMREEINNQNEMFQKEIARIKRDAENQQIEKRKAEFEIEKLKLELQKKNREQQLKLIEALKRNEPKYHDYYQPPPPPYQQQQHYDSLSEFEQPRPQAKRPQPPPTPPKMPKTNKVQEYESLSFHEQQSHKIPHKPSKKTLVDDDYEPRHFDESEVMTLQADSKKIPLALQANTKLTMSKIENYGKDSAFYQDIRPAAKPYKPQPIIEEVEQPRINSRKSQRQMDELDRLVGSREAKRWEMSTVKDDITKEIEELLRKKDGSKMSEAGRQVLSRGGLPYEGNINTLSSNRISAVSNGTLDIDKVHDRNEARLRELKALGVQTVNTNNDDDLNRLNQLLKHYQ